jgi:hypothetical protein
LPAPGLPHMISINDSEASSHLHWFSTPIRRLVPKYSQLAAFVDRVLLPLDSGPPRSPQSAVPPEDADDLPAPAPELIPDETGDPNPWRFDPLTPFTPDDPPPVPDHLFDPPEWASDPGSGEFYDPAFWAFPFVQPP